MFEWLGLCVFGLPCPLKRALINGYFINQEVLAGSKRLWGQGSAEVLNQFPNPPGLDIFCFLEARRFIIILPLRRNGTGRQEGLDVKQRYRKWEESNAGSKGGWSGNKLLPSQLLIPISLFFFLPHHSVSSSHIFRLCSNPWALLGHLSQPGPFIPAYSSYPKLL